MAMRNIIRIDEEKCDGCGQCVTSCAEGAIEIVNGKAKLVRESHCDGLGACIGDCPRGALTIERREAKAFDEEAAAEASGGENPSAAPEPDNRSCPDATGQPAPALACGCPGTMAKRIDRGKTSNKQNTGHATASQPSMLTHWPVQLQLIDPAAPYFRGARLLVAADCTAFAMGSFHAELLRGRSVVVACPKLDDRTGYVEKLSALIAEAGIQEICIARMEVPCCGGMTALVREALARTGASIPVREITVGIDGNVVAERDVSTPETTEAVPRPAG